MEGIGATVVAEYVPDHCPPAVRPEQLRHLDQSQVLIQPVESGGADAEIKASFVQGGILKR